MLNSIFRAFKHPNLEEDPHQRRGARLLKMTSLTRISPLLVATLALTSPVQGPAQNAGKETRPQIPEELLDDEHVREEFGVNHFTAPSIKKIFDDLAVFGRLPYNEVKRPIAKKIPRDRIALSLSMGRLIAEGFLVVQAEKLEPLEDIGRALLKQAKVLGTGRRVTAHANSLLEKGVIGEWTSLKDELAKTQADVQAELLLLRDVEVAHLLSLGGWLRAFEMATTITASDYSADKARSLARSEIVEYFLFSLEGLHPDLQHTPIVVALRDGLTTIQKKTDVPTGKALSQEEVIILRDTVTSILDKILEE